LAVFFCSLPDLYFSRSVTVGCTSPATPSISPTTSTITTGNTVTFTVNNVAANSWYAILDNSGTSYATSSYKTSSSSFSITSNTFTTAGTYNLKLSADALSGCPASFSTATITVNATLPLLLLNFTGTYTNGQLLFNWSTTDEINVHHFELEESNDGNGFSTLAAIPLQGTPDLVHHYNYEQNKFLLIATYYRLRIVDNDGKIQYSHIILLEPSNLQKPVVKVMPNPFKDAIILHYNTLHTAQLSIVITDVFGQTINKIQKEIRVGENNITIRDLGNLPSGTYFLAIYNKAEMENTFFKLQK
jgi:Secretion system C-terminal sorting domain